MFSEIDVSMFVLWLRGQILVQFVCSEDILFFRRKRFEGSDLVSGFRLESGLG